MRISDWSSDVCSSDLFMGQDVASARPLVPTCEIFGRYAIFGTAMMLQANTPEFIAESQQKIVMIEMFGSEQCAGLADQFLVHGDLFGGEIEVTRFVCHDIQRDFGREFDCLEIFSGKNRGIDQSVIVDSLVSNGRPRCARRTERGRRLPPVWINDTHRNRDVPGIISSGIERD